MPLYRKKQSQEMFPWSPETDMEGVSISQSDLLNGSPKLGDMVAINANDTADKWLVAKKFFEDNYEPVE